MTDGARLSALEDVRLGRDLVVDDPARCICGSTNLHERCGKCSRCKQLFWGVGLFDEHQVKDHPPDGYEQGGVGVHSRCPCEKGQPYHRYCINTTTMRERGWWQDTNNVWHGPDTKQRSNTDG